MMVLKRGSRGALVDILQLALSRALGVVVEVDGCFGAQTRLALLEFQRAHALPPTGEAGSAVWHALEPYTAAHVTYAMRRGESFAQAAESLGAGLAAVETANPGLDLLAPRAGQRITVPLPFDAVPALAWSSYANGQSLRALTARYPFLQPATFGRSSMGKPLRCLLFGEGPNAALLTAAHHANEWITAPALLRYASSLAAGYAAGEERARELYAKTRLCFVPLVNPDGVDLVTGALEEGYYAERAREIAADYPSVPYPDGWKANIRGTDLNLQYPADWEAAREIKYAQGWVTPAPRDYVGSAPLAASEARALYTLTRQLMPKTVLALHTQGEVIYWQYHGYAPEGAAPLAEKLAAASGYALDTVPDESSNAGYKDWAIDTLDIPAFTVECGLGASPLPLEQLDGISAAVAAICAELAAWCAAS